MSMTVITEKTLRIVGLHSRCSFCTNTIRSAPA
jgi:hypothetical protein